MDLGAIITGYEDRLNKAKLSNMKIADRVEVKKQLKNKLIKELQGFRTRPSEYQDLLKLDQDVVKSIVQTIKSQLKSLKYQDKK